MPSKIPVIDYFPPMFNNISASWHNWVHKMICYRMKKSYKGQDTAHMYNGNIESYDLNKKGKGTTDVKVSLCSQNLYTVQSHLAGAVGTSRDLSHDLFYTERDLL